MQDSNAFVRTALQAIASRVSVDFDSATIAGAAVMAVGPTGYGVSIDKVTLQQAYELLNAAPNGVKCRFKHPHYDEQTGFIADDLDIVIGRVANGRIDGDTLRADVILGDYAANLPGLGDVRSYLLKRAASDPMSFGLSAVFVDMPEPILDSFGNVIDTVARIIDLRAIDCVGRGAATPNGLLGIGTEDAVLIAEEKRVAQIRQLGEALHLDGDVVLLAIAAGDGLVQAAERFRPHAVAAFLAAGVASN